MSADSSAAIVRKPGERGRTTAALAGARAGIAAALSGHEPDASAYLLRKIKPALVIAEAGLALREAMDGGNGHRSNCTLSIADCPWCSAAHAYDDAIRTATEAEVDHAAG